MIMIRKLFSYSRSEQGSVAIVVAFAIFALVLGTGVAVDMARAQILQSKIQSSLDSSGLAAVASLGSKPADVTEIAWVTLQAQRFFNVNFRPGYLGTSNIIPTVSLDADGKSYTLTAQSTQSTTFMNVAGVTNIRVGANSKVTRALGGEGMELVLVLDNTLSMSYDVGTGAPCGSCPTSKIEVLKTAANNLLDILYGAGNDTTPGLYVSVIPFSQTVNIGPSHTNFLNAGANGVGAITTKDWGPNGGSWGGCVMTRTAPDDITDINPSQANGGFDVFWNPPYQALTAAQSLPLIDRYGYYSNRNPERDQPDPGTFPSYGWRRDNADGSFNSYYPYKPWIFAPTSQGPNYTCPKQLVSLVSSKATIKNTINSMYAIGDTFISEGISWGWRMLSPNWRGFWGGEMDARSQPYEYNKENSRKVVVLMSDGWNRFFEYNYTAYGYLENFVDTYTSITMNSGDHEAKQNDVEDLFDIKTLNVCTNMKNNGIIIYTIGFGLKGPKSNSTMNEALLKSCATDSSHYFYAPTNDDLKAAFKQIANSLLNLRISK